MTASRPPEQADTPPKPGTRDAPYSVSRVVVGVNRTLERVVSTIWVEGEVASLSRPASGHIYFSLCDSKAELRAVMWRSDAAKLKFQIENGMTLLVRVRLGLYEQGGKFQLYVSRAEPAGLGADALALEQLRKKLAAEGLFSSDRKKELPRLPRRIGVVTSKTGAAVRDIVRAVQRRYPVPILVAHAQVQGPSAPREIVYALSQLSRTDVDVIIVGRGGGSSIDLGAFNDERVVRAVAKIEVPVISAVGHEVDVSLTDLAADRRAATPTMAGEMAVPVLADLAASLEATEKRIARELRYRLDSARQRLDGLSNRGDRSTRAAITTRRDQLAHAHRAVAAAHPTARLAEARSTLTRLASRAEASWKQRFGERGHRLATAVSKLEALSPLGVLERGYALVTKDVHVVSDAKDIASGDLLTVRLRRGALEVRVESVRNAKEE